MNSLLKLLLASVLGCIVSAPLAEPTPNDIDTKLRASLAVLLPSLVPDTIADSPIDGIYEVAFGTRIVYLTADGRFLIKGGIVDLETRIEVTEARETALKQKLLATLDEEQMIVFGDKDLPHTVTVFTDIDCGYCRKLHGEMEKYNAAGIRVRYLAYPRGGLKSESARKAVSVWCADDRQAAMNEAKSGASLPQRSCDNPVAQHYKLGRQFGINGTPALMLEDGSMVPGYVPARRLAAALNEAAANLAKAQSAGAPAAN